MTIAEKVIRAKEDYDAVYEAGKKAEYDNIYEAGYSHGKEDGHIDEHNAFWDTFQQNGTRTAYSYAFSGFRNADIFYPKYDIVPSGSAVGMMQYFCADDGAAIDLAARLEECGVRLDTSKATSMANAFYWRLGVTRLPEISLVSATVTSSVIANNPKLITVDKLIFSNDGTQPSANTVLASNENLVNIVVEGVIGKSMNLGGCEKLSADSLKSIISHLKNYSGTDSEFTNKLTVAAGCWTRLENDSTAPDGGTWKNYVNDLGWNT